MASGIGEFISSIIGPLASAGTMRLLGGKEGYKSWLAGQTGSELTGAQQQQNEWSAQQAELSREFNASEAQKQRDWTESMDNSKYQRTVEDMLAAGVNPALAMSGGVSPAPSGSAASGSAASSSSPGNPLASMSDLMQLLLMRKQGKLLDAQARQAKDMGDAAMSNANTNAQNAETNKENAQSNRMNAETNALLANNQIRIGDSIVSLNEAQMSSIAQQIKESESRISFQEIERLSKELDYQFDKDLFETNKALVCQQLVYRAVEMSEMRSVIALNNQLKENASKQGEILDADKVSSQLTAEWKQSNPKLVKFLEAAGLGTSVVGNILSVSLGASRSKSASTVDVSSSSVNHSYVHKR